MKAIEDIQNHINRNVARSIRTEMKRWGATIASVASAMQVTQVRVREARDGNPGWLGSWDSNKLQDWIDGIRSAWLYR